MSEVEELIINTPRGLYCPPADIYIDAWQSVPRTIVTHAHSDHARIGSQRYLCATSGVPLLRQRLGDDATIDTIDYSRPLNINDVKISLHPAGHVLGSAQVRLERKGKICLISGDYKLQSDPTCERFEPILCHTFVTECTFGLPLFRWQDSGGIIEQINHWWRDNQLLERTSILLAYSLGKAQRLLASIDPTIGPILLHGAVQSMTAAYEKAGVKLPATQHASVENAKLHKGRALVIAPPSAMNSTWSRKFSPFSMASASGWMQIRGFRRRRGVDRGFVLSDHVDWPGLLRTIEQTRAEKVIATHGYTSVLSRWLKEKGIDTAEFQTRFSGEEEELAEENETLQ